jgi:GntR family transcriptional regulator
MSSLVQGRPEERTRLPLYVQVADWIRAEIARARLEPGTMLPSEADLQRRFDVSRATVRQAVQELAFAGVVKREQGRGTFVAVPPLERALPELTSFSEHLASKGLVSSSRLINWEAVSGPRERDGQSLPSPDSPDPRLFGRSSLRLARAIRLRLANDRPVGLHTTLVPLAIAEAIGFTEERLRRDERLSLYAELERAGFRLSEAEEHLRARLLARPEAALLGVPPSTAAMSVLRLTRDEGGRLLEAVRAVYLGDKYDYVVSLKRKQAGRRQR